MKFRLQNSISLPTSASSQDGAFAFSASELQYQWRYNGSYVNPKHIIYGRDFHDKPNWTKRMDVLRTIFARPDLNFGEELRKLIDGAMNGQLKLKARNYEHLLNPDDFFTEKYSSVDRLVNKQWQVAQAQFKERHHRSSDAYDPLHILSSEFAEPFNFGNQLYREKLPAELTDRSSSKYLFRMKLQCGAIDKEQFEYRPTDAPGGSDAEVVDDDLSKKDSDLIQTDRAPASTPNHLDYLYHLEACDTNVFGC